MTQSSHNKKQELGISELIAILAALVALWYFLYEAIIKLSTELQKIEIVIFPSVLAHGLVFFNAIFICIILDGRLRGRVTGILYRKSNQYLKGFWLPLIVFCLVSYIIASLGNPVSHSFSLIFNWGLTLLIEFVFLVGYYWEEVCFLKKSKSNICKKVYSFLNNYKKDIVVWVSLIAIIMIFYSLIFYSISSKVKVVFHKEVFIDEDVTFSIERTGYMALPDIQDVTLNTCHSLELSQSKYYRIKKNSVRWSKGLNYLEVRYNTKWLNHLHRIEVPYLSK